MSPHFVPEGWHTITPRIVATNVEQFLSFLRQVFNATGEYLKDRPSVIRIGDSLVMVSEAGIRDVTTAFLYVYVADVDVVYQKALDAGAQSLERPFVTPYGDRRCMVIDNWGNIWQIATYTDKSDRPEIS